MSHSIIAPSSAGIWGKPDGCTGYVLMAQLYPELEESEGAREGTAAHEPAADMVLANACGGQNFPKFEDVVGSTASNNVVFTEEMYEGAKLYADDIKSVMQSTGVFGGEGFGVERKVLARRIHELSYGTVDAFLYDRAGAALYVWDYKFGFEQVEAFENWQTINYAAGILDELGIDGYQDQNLTVHIRIVQPRAFHRDGPIREWAVKASDLRAYFNTLSSNAEEALGPNAVTRTGSHCKNCPARHACPAALKAGARLFEVAGRPVPAELSPEALSVQFSIIQRASKQLEYLESGFEEQVKALVKSGQNVPGYRVEQGYGRETWNQPIEQVLQMGEMMGHDLQKKEAITPKQAVNLGIDEAVIKAYSHRPHSGLKLVKDNGNKAKQVFSR